MAPPAPVRARHPARWVAERWFVLACGLAAAIPIIAATGRAIVDRWYPLGDDANIATRAYDVLTGHSPLLGHFSQASGVVGQPLYEPGPLAYWPLALPARFGGAAAMVIVVGLINVGAVMGAVALARRRGGTGLMIATAVAIPVMLASLPTVAYRDIWVQAEALLPFTLLVFIAWCVAVGEYRLLPLGVVVASLVTQAHLAYVLPTLVLAAVALSGLVVARVREARAPDTTRHADDREVVGKRRRARPWILAAVAVGVVCWLPPLIEQATHHPGNLVLIRRAATTKKTTLGPDAGGHAVVRAVGIPPWWLRTSQTSEERVRDVGFAPPRTPPHVPGLGWLSIVSTVVILSALLVALVLAARRRRTDLVAATTLALALIGALFVIVSSTPSGESAWSASLGYTTWWAAPAGMWAWLVLGLSFASLGGATARANAAGAALRRRLGAPRAPAVAAGACVAGVAAIGVLVSASAGRDPLRSAYAPLHHVANRVAATVPRNRVVRVEAGPSFTALDVEAGVIYALRRRGVSVVTPELAIQLGHAYEPRPGGFGYVVRVEEGHPAPPPGGRVIARVRLGDAENTSLLIGRLTAAQGTVSVLGAPAGSR